jgi:hypothetical protein
MRPGLPKKAHDWFPRPREQDDCWMVVAAFVVALVSTGIGGAGFVLGVLNHRRQNRRDKIVDRQRLEDRAPAFSGSIEIMNPDSRLNWYRLRVDLDKESAIVDRINVTIVEGDGIRFSRSQDNIDPDPKVASYPGPMRAAGVARWAVDLDDDSDRRMVLLVEATSGDVSWGQKVVVDVPT